MSYCSSTVKDKAGKGEGLLTRFTHIYTYMGALPTCMSVYYVCVHTVLHKSQFRDLSLELLAAVSCHVGAGNWTQVL